MIVIKFITSIYSHFIMFFPNPLGNKLRIKYWRKKLNFLGKNIFFDVGIDMGGANKIYIGDNFLLGRDSVIGATESEGIFIGNNVSVGRGTYFHGSNHRFENLDIPINKQGTICSSIEYMDKKYSIILEDDIWIGSNSVILSGAHLSKGSVVSAGSVVSGFYPPYSIIVGNPSRLSGTRKK